MANNVLQFPEDRCIRKKLEESAKELQDLYDSIKLCYETIEKLEEKVRNLEKDYDMLFAQYLRAVGLENVETEFINLVSGNISINLETEEINYEFTNLGEDEDTEKEMSNYSESETTYMVQLYQENPCAETVDLLVEQLKRSKKSIIGKLSRRCIQEGSICLKDR